MSEYYEKIMVTGDVIEVWRYDSLNTKGGGNSDGKTTDGIDKEANYQKRQRIRRNRIRHLICSNFDMGSKFVTLTFADRDDFSISDVKVCNRFFKRFVQRVRYRYPDFLYVAVIEFQDANGRGAVHYHMVCNLPFIKKSELEELWSGGFVQVNRIDHVDNVGAYVVKYMLKDTEDPRLMGENAYLHSRGLAEPTCFCTWKGDLESWRQLHNVLQEKSPVYTGMYTSESAGNVYYYQYNLNRHNTSE